jgi:ADP-glucose pyrophosphorylase
MDNVRAVLLAGGLGTRMGRLAVGRSKPMVPFGGQCHLIDFSLANAVRSGLAEILVLSQHDEGRLIRYLLRTWDRRDGFRVHFGPHDQRLRGRRTVELGARPPERGTADALLVNAKHVFGKGHRDVLILHADHVYCFDYREMLAWHRATGAAATIGYQEIEPEYVRLFGMVEFDADGRLVQLVEKPSVPTTRLVFSAFCLFDGAVLRACLEELAGGDWSYDISKDVIPALLASGHTVRGFRVDGYWEDIGTVDRYHRAHLRLLGAQATLRPDEMPMTLHPEIPRRHVDVAPGLCDTLVAADLVNEGRIERAVVYPRVHVGRGAVVRDSVLLPGCHVLPGAVVEQAIVLDHESVAADRRGLGEEERP